MSLRNREGTEIDPIPFFVTVGTAFLLLYSFAPGYLLSLGLSVESALGTTTAAFGSTLVATYYQLVHTANPHRHEEVPATVRFRKLVYAVLIATAGMLLLLLPIFMQ